LPAETIGDAGNDCRTGAEDSILVFVGIGLEMIPEAARFAFNGEFVEAIEAKEY
jgi:hypothetical protein